MLVNPKKILVVMTGGTIDSEWDGTKDAIAPAEHSLIPGYFKVLQKQAKLYEDMEFVEACMKDSRSITPEDRMKILNIIEESDALKVIITHGTYTIPDTASFLEDNLKRRDQVVIVTGAMIPIKGFETSDGPFNLGYSIAQVNTLSAGVYVCVSARVYTPKRAEQRTAPIFQTKQ